MFAWRQCKDDWRDVPSPAEPGLHLSLRCLWEPGAALSVHFYYNNTSPGAEWSHSQMSPYHIIMYPPHHCCHLSHEREGGEMWEMLF